MIICGFRRHSLREVEGSIDIAWRRLREEVGTTAEHPEAVLQEPAEFTLVAINGAKLDLPNLTTARAGARDVVPGLNPSARYGVRWLSVHDTPIL